MKKLFWILLLLVGATRLSAQTIASFRFKATQPTSSDTTAGWTTVYGDPSTAVRTGTAPGTGISISSINRSLSALADGGEIHRGDDQEGPFIYDIRHIKTTNKLLRSAGAFGVPHPKL